LNLVFDFTGIRSGYIQVYFYAKIILRVHKTVVREFLN
jgi:hypothetical protein